MASDPALTGEDTGGSSGNNADLEWFPHDFFLNSRAADALGWSTRVAGPVDLRYDAVGTTWLYRVCDTGFDEWECGVTIDCWYPTSGTVRLLGELSDFNDGDSCCEGELAVEMEGIVFDAGGPVIEDLHTQVFVEPYNDM